MSTISCRLLFAGVGVVRVDRIMPVGGGHGQMGADVRPDSGTAVRGWPREQADRRGQ